MSTVRPYTRMNTYLRAVAKKSGLTPDEYLPRFISCCASFGDRGYLMFNSFLLDTAILKGDALHIFMPDRQFCDWLVSCVPALDPGHAATLAEAIENRAGCLHFPTSSGLCSIGFWIPKYVAHLDGTAAPNHSGLIMSFSTDNQINLAQLSIELSPQSHCDEKGLWYAKLIVGLGMYLACFPDQAIDGLPSDLKHAGQFKKLQSRTIGVTHRVVLRDGPTPHFRVGHFRILSSERFTKKRGQVVFIHGCFVKGRAATVLEPQEIPA